MLDAVLYLAPKTMIFLLYCAESYFLLSRISIILLYPCGNHLSFSFKKLMQVIKTRGYHRFHIHFTSLMCYKLCQSRITWSLTPGQRSSCHAHNEHSQRLAQWGIWETFQITSNMIFLTLHFTFRLF